jgi:hypothetical protein
VRSGPAGRAGRESTEYRRRADLGNDAALAPVAALAALGKRASKASRGRQGEAPLGRGALVGRLLCSAPDGGAASDVIVRRSGAARTSARRGVVRAPAISGERIDLDDEIAALLRAVEEELTDTVVVGPRRTRRVLVATRWRTFVAGLRVFLGLSRRLRAVLADGAYLLNSKRDEIVANALVVVVVVVVSVSLGVAVALLLART